MAEPRPRRIWNGFEDGSQSLYGCSHQGDGIMSISVRSIKYDYPAAMHHRLRTRRRVLSTLRKIFRVLGNHITLYRYLIEHPFIDGTTRRILRCDSYFQLTFSSWERYRHHIIVCLPFIVSSIVLTSRLSWVDTSITGRALKVLLPRNNKTSWFHFFRFLVFGYKTEHGNTTFQLQTMSVLSSTVISAQCMKVSVTLLSGK